MNTLTVAPQIACKSAPSDSSTPSPACESVPSDPSSPSPACWHADFLEMLPKIQDHAHFAFRHLREEQRDEAIQEVTCNACLAFARLMERGRAEAATWSSIAKYAVAQVRAGRRVGNPLNVKDITSSYCQKRNGVTVRRLDRWDDQDEEWTQLAVEDRHATPADLAALRIDFREFLGSLSKRNRQIALQLARQHATNWIAEQFQISAGRVSQLRLELWEAWQRFQGEVSGEPATALVPSA